MNELNDTSQVTVSFDDSMEVLIQELELAIRWHTPAVLLVAYGSVYVRNDSVAMLENFLMEHDQKIVWLLARDSAASSLEFWHKILEETDDVVFFLDGGDLVNQRCFMTFLDHHGYMFTEKRARVVFWLTFNEASALAYQAPSIWTGRQQLIELSTSPKPEQILQSALESAWQGTGEYYADQFEDTEAKISLRESFLTDLPKNNETTSIRANLLLTLGILHWRKGDYEKANEMLQNALSMSAQMRDNWFEAKCFNAVALVKTSLGQNEDAIDSYKQAILLAPDQIFAWNNLGNLCLKIGRNHEAMIAFQKAIEHNPSDPVAWNGMGNVYTRSGYIDDAIAAYRRSIQLAPSLSHPWNGLGEVYAKSGRLNDAVEAYQNAIALNDRFVQPWLGLARLYETQDRYRDASKAYQQALMIDAKCSVTWNDLGCAYLEAKRYVDALEAFNKAIELDRGYGWAYSNLGLAHANSENIEESIRFYIKSLNLLQDEGQRSLTWNRLANSYRKLGDYQNAIKAYENADSHPPKVLQSDDNVSSDVQPEAVSEAEPVAEAETDLSGERSVESPAGVPVIELDEDLEEETPLWIFQSDEAHESVNSHNFNSTSHLFGFKLGGFTTHPATTTQENRGTSMQMILPFNTNKHAATTKIRPVDSPSIIPQSEESDAGVWNERGNQLLRSGKYDEAIQAYNKAIKYDRYSGWAYTNLGIAYLQLGKYAEAVLLLQKSLELLETDKEKAVAWNELGNLYRCLNDYHNAVISYQKADELDPEQESNRDSVEYFHAESNVGNAQMWNELGDTFIKSGSYTEASNCYRKVTEMMPLSGQAYSNLALSLAYQSRLGEAIPIYLKSIELFKTDREKADAWNRLGNVFRRLNDYDNAVMAYKNAVKLNNEKSTLLTRTRFSLLGNCAVDKLIPQLSSSTGGTNERV